MKKMHVCVVTGTRAEYGIWRPVLAAIEASKKLRLSLVATGMHLQRQFGHTLKDIAFELAARVPMYKAGEPAAKSLARGVQGLAAVYRRIRPDLVMVLGDRLEVFAAASAALAERIALAHVHGGETAPGVWDEQIRHAVTKMAQVHFCATEAAGERIVRMGEEPGRVHVVGAPGLDLAVRQAEAFRERLAGQPRLVRDAFRDPAPLLLLHPGSPDEGVEYRQARLLIDMLVKAFPDKRVCAIGPNNDPGHRGILRAYREAGERILLDMSTPQASFWAMLQASGLLVGNSSSGIIEAASFGVPVINIGPRQAGRERNANVIDVSWDRAAIGQAIRKARSDRGYLRRVALRRNIYGDGRAAGRIVGILESLAGCDMPLTKRFF